MTQLLIVVVRQLQETQYFFRKARKQRQGSPKNDFFCYFLLPLQGHRKATYSFLPSNHSCADRQE